MRNLTRHLAKPFCLLLIVSFALLDLSVQSARAGMIGTETIMEVRTAQDARAALIAHFEREEVEKALADHGLDAAEAKARVASLSDAEVIRAAEMMEQLPAGAGAAGVIGAIVFVGVVLLITDIVGLTNVYPFVRPAR
jgi:hypothetical protein